MQKTHYELANSFEVKGRWWSPSQSDNPRSGTLSYSSDEIRLTLDGSLDKPTLDELGTLSSNSRCHSHLHGVSDHGQRFTLLRVFETGRKHNLQETTSVEYSAIYLVADYHTSEAESLRFESISVGLSHLDAFTDLTPFTITTEVNQQELESATASYHAPETLALRVEPAQSQFTLETEVRWRDSRIEVSLMASRYFDVTPDESQSLEWYLTTIWRLCHLLTLLTDEEVAPTWIRFSNDGKTSDGWLLYRSTERRSENDNPRPSSLLLFYLAHVRDDFSAILDHWFSASDVLLDSIHLLMDAHRNQGNSLQGRFLTLTQSLEAFSRATGSSEYMRPEHYEHVVASLVSAIPSTVGSDHRNALKNRIRYGNEHSLRKRIKSLFSTLNESSVDCVCRSSGDFISGIVDTRNYLTHYTYELRQNALAGVDLSWACEKIALLLRILWLRRLGLNEELIVNRIKEHPRLMQYMFLSKSHRERIG